MSKVIGYIRVSADEQDARRQRREITEYASRKDIRIAEFIEVTAASQESSRQRRIEELCRLLEPGDNLIVSEFAKLGRSTGGVIVLVNRLIEHGVLITIVKQNLVLQQKSQDMTATAMVAIVAMFAEMERNYVSLRAKEALATKKSHGTLAGKPKGTIQPSMYDRDRDMIEELLRLGVSQRRIITHHLGYGTPNSLNHYIRTRGIGMKAGADIDVLHDVDEGGQT